MLHQQKEASIKLLDFGYRIEEYENQLKALEKRIDTYDTAKEVDLPQEGTLEVKDILEAI
jgi:hypothetical protein